MVCGCKNAVLSSRGKNDRAEEMAAEEKTDSREKKRERTDEET